LWSEHAASGAARVIIAIKSFLVAIIAYLSAKIANFQNFLTFVFGLTVSVKSRDEPAKQFPMAIPLPEPPANKSTCSIPLNLEMLKSLNFGARGCNSRRHPFLGKGGFFCGKQK
jgi:hypothetical protein